MKKDIIIAIDGYSACGKSTTAKLVAERLNYKFIDTGAMYRAVTLYFLKNFISIDNPKEVKNALEKISLKFVPNDKTGKSEIYLNHQNVENEIRQMPVAQKVSEVSALSDVRTFLVAQQQIMGKSKSVVMEGRDIGSKVFPEAELKVFVTADKKVRAQRRQQELLEKGELIDLGDVIENIEKRDRIDTTRADSPLVKVDDALVLDTSNRSINEQVEFVVHHANEIINT